MHQFLVIIISDNLLSTTGKAYCKKTHVIFVVFD